MNHEIVSYIVSAGMVGFGTLVTFLIKRTFNGFEKQIEHLISTVDELKNQRNEHASDLRVLQLELEHLTEKLQRLEQEVRK